MGNPGDTGGRAREGGPGADRAWSWEESRRRQLRDRAALPLRRKLEALEAMQALAEKLRRGRKPGP